MKVFLGKGSADEDAPISLSFSKNSMFVTEQLSSSEEAFLIGPTGAQDARPAATRSEFCT